ncbi:hypothetical protein EC957_007289 [Mortierella hygrophila]|uniref:Uncharacterized protein n=1 Tax=Mortierella hygrophila TaxID=979708 RepID=A0A9P6JY50_9FUNG|nr:hypothetical protein EC957_007289 [Mortierella hygrophila]
MDGLIPSATPQIVSSSPSAIANNNTNTVETQGSTISSGGERINDEYTDSIELSAPFQLLLVNRRFADIAVRSLWKGIVFHGHDSFQVQALLSTLRGDDGTSTINQPVVSQTDANCLGLDTVKDNNPVKSTPALLSVLDENEPTQGRSTLVDSVQQSVKRFNGVRYPAQTTATLSDGQQQQREQAWMPSPQDRSGVLRRHSTTGVESARSPASQSQLPTNLQSPVLMPRWSYRQMPRNIVLNFSHPQASPHLLVSVLECIGSRCRDQVKALDLRANEKMQAAGLETPSELERLFGSGFSRLQYLRLQGGFVDNQLLGALTKGIISATSLPPSSEATASQERRPQQEQQQQQQTGPFVPLHMTPPCRLSQVFLGPGSVTDSAIAKLIVAASHCLEVFTVTSCVDVGGGALASLLTECPKLRVLAVHKSLARDVELLEGLGVDSDSLPNPNSPLGAILPDNLPSPSRKQIVSPLERLELGSTQLTSTGIAEIVRGVSRTLRFLVLEPRHFKEALLRDVIVPLCKKLEGLHFDDPDHYYQHQLQQSRMQRQRRRQQNLDQQQPPDQNQSPSVNSIPDTMEAENRRPKKRYFKLRRSRRPTATELSPPDTNIVRKDDATAAQDDDGSSCPRPSPWLGETSTAEWVEHGNCALWAASAVGSIAGFEANGGLISNGNGAMGHSHSMSGSRGRGMSSFFRGIGTRLSSILSPRNNNTNGNQGDVSAPENTAAVAADHECDIDRILARFGLAAAEVDILRQVLAPTLKSFVVMQADLLPVAESKPIASSLGSLTEGDVVLMDDALEELSKEEANMRLAVVLTMMAVYGSLVTLAAALSSLLAECT